MYTLYLGATSPYLYLSIIIIHHYSEFFKAFFEAKYFRFYDFSSTKFKNPFYEADSWRSPVKCAIYTNFALIFIDFL